MPATQNPRPLPTGPVVRLVVSVLLIVFVAIRGSKLGIPVMAQIVLGLGLLLIAGEQVRRILAVRRPPVKERVSKHPLGLE